MCRAHVVPYSRIVLTFWTLRASKTFVECPQFGEVGHRAKSRWWLKRNQSMTKEIEEEREDTEEEMPVINVWNDLLREGKRPLLKNYLSEDGEEILCIVIIYGRIFPMPFQKWNLLVFLCFFLENFKDPTFAIHKKIIFKTKLYIYFFAHVCFFLQVKKCEQKKK